MKATKIAIALSAVGLIGLLVWVGTRSPEQRAAAAATPAVARATTQPTAQPTPQPTELERVAAEAGVNPIELEGAVNATGMSPREYLQSTGELPMPTPQPTAKPIVTAAFTGRVTPRVSSVGGFQTFDFDITNDGSTDINGINLRVGGASDKYTIIGTLPSGGRVDQGIFGNKTFYWPLKVAPGQTTSVTVTLSPNEPGNHYVTFYLEDGAKLGLKSRSGSSDDVSMTVAVTR